MKEFVAHRMLVQSSLRKKWKTMLLLFVAGIIVVAALFAWNRSHYKSIDNLHNNDDHAVVCSIIAK